LRPVVMKAISFEKFFRKFATISRAIVDAGVPGSNLYVSGKR
jgi:hypothetical protein